MAEAVAVDQLKSFVARIESLEKDKADISADISAVYAEAKANGFDVKVLRQVIRLRKMEEADRREQEEILALYKNALGMLCGIPLGKWAISNGGSNAA